MPHDPFVVCAPYANTLPRRFGTELDALVGKQLEVTGLMEQFSDGSGEGGDIRIFEEGQEGMVGAK